MQFLLALAIAAVAATQASDRFRRSDPVLVRAVIDGETIEVMTIGRVRLLGVDAAAVEHGEKAAGTFGKAARDRLVSLVSHRYVRLEWETAGPAASTRHRAYVVREDGVFVNAVLVREGLARVSARFQGARLAELQNAEREALSARRGLWSAGGRRRVAPARSARYTAQAKTPLDSRPTAGPCAARRAPEQR